MVSHFTSISILSCQLYKRSLRQVLNFCASLSSSFSLSMVSRTSADELTISWPLAADGAYSVYFLIWEGISGKHSYLCWL